MLSTTTVRGPARLLLPLLLVQGCVGELTIFAALAFGMTLGAWMLGRGRRTLALYEVETMRAAIGSGQHRALEERLRKELALAAAGEAVSEERQWLARAQLGGLLVAEWRLDEARAVYAVAAESARPHLAALSQFGRHEILLLTSEPDEERLEEIRRDRDTCLLHVPPPLQRDVAAAWSALEGLCLVRMGRAREALPLLEQGLGSLTYNPARVVYLFHLAQAYEHVGERRLAGERYAEAAQAFPGTRLASEAGSRAHALAPGAHEGFFRGMLPEAPIASGEGSASGPAETPADIKKRTGDPEPET